MLEVREKAELKATSSKIKVRRSVENKLEAELNTSVKTKFEGKQRQDFGRLNYNSGLDYSDTIG